MVRDRDDPAAGVAAPGGPDRALADAASRMTDPLTSIVANVGWAIERLDRPGSAPLAVVRVAQPEASARVASRAESKNFDFIGR
jgi:hypothetical protein